MNLYSYVENDPTNETDPTGMCHVTLHGSVTASNPPPTFEPGFWNEPGIIDANNCWSYALNRPYRVGAHPPR